MMDGYNMNEDAGAVSVCVDSGVTEGFQTDLTVSLSATDGTACEYIFMLQHQLLCIYIPSLFIAVVDDTGLPGAEFALVFPAGSSESTRCISIPIVNDTLLEGIQEFTVTATDVGSHALINTPSSSTTISITDNECKTCDVYFSLHH